MGAIAAQSIGEPGTQLTMRTFHIGGAAQISEQSFVASNFDGRIQIKNKSVVKNSDGQTVAMVRNMIVSVLDPDGSERAAHRIQYGARLLVDDGDIIKRGQRIAEWDPYTRPMLTEVEGIAGFEDLVEGQSMTETLDELTGIAKRVVTDWRAIRGANLRPAIVIKDKYNKPLKLSRGGEARYQLAVDAIISVDPGARVRAGDVIARIPTESAKTRDITGGLPRVAELFEARRPKEAAIIAETSGTIRFGRDYKNKRRIIIEPSDKEEEPREYLVPKGKHVHLQDGDLIEKGDAIVEGNPAPHDILAIKGVKESAAYLVNEIQDVYRLQGVAINDKHIEVIVRQMLQKVEIDDIGETDLIQGEQIDKIELDEVNARAKEEGKKEAVGHPVLLGITKASLQSRSFISAASFQETTRVLTEAAVAGKVDTLKALRKTSSWPAHSRWYRRNDEPAARDRSQARCAHSRGARAGGGGQGRSRGRSRGAGSTAGGRVGARIQHQQGPPFGGLFFTGVPSLKGRRSGAPPTLGAAWCALMQQSRLVGVPPTRWGGIAELNLNIIQEDAHGFAVVCDLWQALRRGRTCPVDPPVYCCPEEPGSAKSHFVPLT